MKKEFLEKIKSTVSTLCKEANYGIREDIFEALCQAEKEEKEELPKFILSTLIENINISRKEKIPVCQDTGMAEVFVEVGKGVKIEGILLKKNILEGVKEGYEEGNLRKSVVKDPLFSRKNTGDNTPPLIHLSFSPLLEKEIKIIVFPRGFGAENMGKVAMLNPQEGKEGVKRFVLGAIREAGANPCPPIIVGIGIGGTMQTSMFLAKKALLRPIKIRNPHPKYALLEKELLKEINGLRIGAQGMGGMNTCLGVNIEHFPTHIAGLPLAVNISCYALREAQKVIRVSS